MKLLGEGSAEELKKLNDQVHENFENAIERGETFITVPELLKGTMLEYICNEHGSDYGILLNERGKWKWCKGE